MKPTFKYPLIILGVGLLLGIVMILIQGALQSRPVVQAAVQQTNTIAAPTATLPASTAAPAETAATPPTATITPVPPPTDIPAPTATHTLLELCTTIDLDDPLYTRVDRMVSLERDYVPNDLEVVPLAPENAYYKPLILRQPVHEPLLAILAELKAQEIPIIVVSGYRDYVEQTLAFQKWQEVSPERASNFSAAPGHSEHQLGTVIDFAVSTRPEDHLSWSFAQSAAGLWLAEHATQYGFTLSYPLWGGQQTGYEWEPWHFRYVGPELAQALEDRQLTLTELLHTCHTRR